MQIFMTAGTEQSQRELACNNWRKSLGLEVLGQQIVL